MEIIPTGAVLLFMLKIFTRILLAHVTFPVMPRSVTDTMVASGAELMTSLLWVKLLY